MQSEPIKVLLVEDDPDDALLLREALAEAGPGRFRVAHATRLADGLARLAGERFDVMLLDLSLPDGFGADTLDRAAAQAQNTPIIVLTGFDDEVLAGKAVQSGAQDYLVKGQATGGLLARAVRYAVERHRLLQELRALSLVDALTGLHNRRGFLTLAQQQIKTADRSKRPLALVYVDLDGFKTINDTLGHAAGDDALREVARLLQETFRDSDIVARLGGDEFAVLAIDVGPESSADVPVARLRRNLDALNAEPGRPYRLAASVGVVAYDAGRPCAIEELLGRADAAMYEQKRARRS